MGGSECTLLIKPPLLPAITRSLCWILVPKADSGSHLQGS